MTELHRLDLSTLATLLRSGELSALDLTEALIARAEGVPDVFVAPTFETARAEARRAEAEIAAGQWRGPLHGIPVGLKDAIDVAGLPTTLCSRLSGDRPATEDAASWTRLRRAGAVLFGKLHCAELCLGAPGPDDARPWPRNPHDAARSPGGSSSGPAVALALGLVPGALGTDTAGSIRLPAAQCGVVGLKPTDGLVPRAGLSPLAPSLDQIGPMARTARDCALLLDALTGTAAYEATLTDDLTGLRLGHDPALSEAVSPERRAALDAALSTLGDLGATVRPVSLPDLQTMTDCTLTIMLYEAHALYGTEIARRRADVSRITRTRIIAGAGIRAEDYERAQALRHNLARRIAETSADLDALILPVTPDDPPVIGEIEALDFMRTPMPTTPANIAGLPAVSVPCGLSARGLPMAVQIIGRRGGDGMVLRIAHAFEQAASTARASPGPCPGC